MSYEGFVQCLCPDGHYYEREALANSTICGCSQEAVWTNEVDCTNGCGDRGDGYCVCGFIPRQSFPVREPAKNCPTCGHPTIQKTYLPPPEGTKPHKFVELSYV